MTLKFTSYFGECKVASHCSFRLYFLMTNDVEQLSIFILIIFMHSEAFMDK